MEEIQKGTDNESKFNSMLKQIVKKVKDELAGGKRER